DARVTQDAFGDGTEVEVASLEGAGAEARTIRAGDLLSDLVATRPDPGAYGSPQSATQRRDPRLDDSLQQTKPPRMQQRERRRSVSPRECNRQTVGRDLQHRQPGLVGPEPVAVLPPLSGLGPIHGGRMN